MDDADAVGWMLLKKKGWFLLLVAWSSSSLARISHFSNMHMRLWMRNDWLMELKGTSAPCGDFQLKSSAISMSERVFNYKKKSSAEVACHSLWINIFLLSISSIVATAPTTTTHRDYLISIFRPMGIFAASCVD